MSLSARLKNALSIGLADLPAANELVSAVNSAGGSLPQPLASTNSPTFAGVTTTGDAIIGGFVDVPTGKGVKVNSIQVLGGQQTAVTPVAVTFTANTPATYTTPTGALTIADGTTPTAVELVKYCDELRGNIVALQAVLHAHGLTT